MMTTVPGAMKPECPLRAVRRAPSVLSRRSGLGGQPHSLPGDTAQRAANRAAERGHAATLWVSVGRESRRS